VSAAPPTGDGLLTPYAEAEPHRIRNIGALPLRLLCSDSPAYAQADTDLP
jgi:mannose-6-phosphate isomerase-like protein (cupin superfamily)